jgi:hypothetical protein
MRYYVQYPIGLSCDLGCLYCFHRSARLDDNLPPQVQPSQFRDWCLKHLPDATEILVHPHGGEPFHHKNLTRLLSLLDNVPDANIDLLTNGLADHYDLMLFLSAYGSRIERVGFTYHRAMLKGLQWRRFVRNALWTVKVLGRERVYVKELLLPEHTEAIKVSTHLWASHGVRVQVQDFHGWDRGRNFDVEYTPEQQRMIDPEYLHAGADCTCREGYKTLLIRGGWQDGDVLRCWEDPVAVGNIHDDWYDKRGVVRIDEKGNRHLEGVPAKYVGSYERDLTPVN